MRAPAIQLTTLLLSLTLLATEATLDPNVRAALLRITSDSLKGHVSFLASDLLEGRATPSRGQDIAAEYIAAQFRRAGLEPAGDNGYFQTAKFVSLEPVKEEMVLELIDGETRISAAPQDAAIQTTGDVALSGASIVKIAPDPAAVARLRHEDIAGKVAAFYVSRAFGPEAEKRYAAIQEIRKLKPALLLVAGPGSPRQQRSRLVAEDRLHEQVPLAAFREGGVAKAIEAAPEGPLAWKLAARIAPPRRTPVTLRNVAGLVRGSDPLLKDTYILVTGHYDHVGVRQQGDGDRIFNGANDDASGTSAVVDIAAALAGLNPRPKRSVLFVALFGEEIGLLGSEYYARHPLVPLTKTIANVNLEHLGRTDATGGPQIASASFTGFDYSGVPRIFQLAGEQTGIAVYKDEKRSDDFFARSDNQALADVGIPSHTVCVAFEFPDYHGVGDEWEKLDYDNMAKVTRMLALGVVMMANSETAPKWNEEQPKAAKYAEAWRVLHQAASE